MKALSEAVFRSFLIIIFIKFAVFGYGQTIYSTSTGGNWNDGSTWVGGVVPTSTNDVVIVSGATVTLNTDAQVASLTVEGSLILGNDLTSRRLEVSGDVSVNSGGEIIKANYDVVDTLLIKGNLSVDGALDLYNGLTQQVRLIFDPGSAINVSISGSGSKDLGGLVVKSGGLTLESDIDINSDFLVESGASFDDAGYTVTLSGNFKVDGTFTSTGNWIFDSPWVQQINSEVTFNNLTINGGGELLIGSNFTVAGDFVVDNNSTVYMNEYYYLYILGDFTVADGSKFTMETGRIYFRGANTQNINIGQTDGEPNCLFAYLYFDNGTSSNPKVINGNLVAKYTTYIYDDAYVTDAANSFEHKFSWLNINGDLALTSKVILTGGTCTSDVKSSFSITSNVIETYGNVTIPENKTLEVLNDLYVNPYNSSTRGLYIYGQVQGSSGHKLIVKPLAQLVLYGENNFPSGFDTVEFKENSYAYYWGNLDQYISDQTTYWHLYLRYQTKTAVGDLKIRGNLQLYDQVTFATGSYDVDLYGNVMNTADRDGSISSDGVFRFILDGNNITLQPHGSSGQYNFNDLIVETRDSSEYRYFYIHEDINVAGDFKALSPSGNFLQVQLRDEHVINGGDSLILDNNVSLVTWGEQNFKTTINSFSNIKLFPNSIVRFARNDVGQIQIIPATGTDWSYGNVHLQGISKKVLDGDIVVKGSMMTLDGNAVLQDDSHQIRIAGDWRMSITSTELSGTNTVIFDGSSTQNISTSRFQNIVFQNTGLKQIMGDLIIQGNLTIDDASVYNNRSNIFIAGNWTETDDAQYHQDHARVEFNGDGAQTVQCSDNSYFASFYINKSGSSKLVSLASDVRVKGILDLFENKAILDLAGNRLYVGGNFYFRNGTEFIHNNGTVIFDGQEINQAIYDLNETDTLTFYNVEFSGSASKILTGREIKVLNNLTINNSILDGDNCDIFIYGDWINTGVFRHNRTVHFIGQEQTITQSAFHTVRFGGGNYTKTLTGNINLTGDLYIDDATLDVSPNNYTITLDNDWHNDSTGSFIAREGTVVFTGESSNIFTGQGNNAYGSGQLPTKPGQKAFYNLRISFKDDYYRAFIRGSLTVQNKLEIVRGRLAQSYLPWAYGLNNIYIYGDFINNGVIENNNYNDTIFFKASTGEHYFKPGDENNYSYIVFDCDNSVKYYLQSDLRFYSDRSLTIRNGYLDLNSNSLITQGSEGDITIVNGGLEIDSAAVLSVGDGATVTNQAGDFVLVGTATAPASLISTSGNFYFLQTGGTIAARFYRVDGIAGDGINIQGGSVDGTNSFQDGIFSNGTGNAYLTLTGLDLGDREIANVIFNSGPTYNVSRTSGVGTITFIDAFGALAGEDYDQDDGDPGTLIDWQYQSAVYWDGNSDGDGDNIHWNDPLNWSNDQVPTDESVVILDHSRVSDSYVVEISSDDAYAKALMIKSGAGNSIELRLDSKQLIVRNDITIDANSILTQTNATDTIKLGGNWSNSGTFNQGTATVVFNGLSGNQNITTLGDTDPFYNLVIRTHGSVSLGSDLAVENNFILDTGQFLAGTHQIKVQGDWIVNSGIFDYGQSVVYLNGADQNIKAGQFYDLILDNSGTKTCLTNIKVAHDLQLNSGVTLDGQDKFIYVGHNWLNYSGTAALVQNGIGTVIFTGSGQVGSTDAGAYSTVFNNVTFDGVGTYRIVQDFSVNGILKIIGGYVYVNNGVYIHGNGSADRFEMTGGQLRLFGADNFPQDFEQIDITGGSVWYAAEVDQQIYPTRYNTLILYTPSSVSSSTKTTTGNITVQATLSVYDERTAFVVDDDTVFLDGSLYLATGAPQIDWRTNGTLVLQGGSITLDPDIEFLNNIIKRNIGTLRLLRTLEVRGDMAILDDAVLAMDTCQVVCTGSGKSFTLAPNARVYSATPATLGSSTGRRAFPYGFDNYNLDKNSRVYLNGTADQILYTVPNYGNLYLTNNNTRRVYMDGNLDVEGNFATYGDDIELIDNGYNINVAGDVDLRNYVASNTSTLTLDGADQSLDDNANGYVTLDLNNLVLSGSGIKSLRISQGDTLKIFGDLTINSGVRFNVYYGWIKFYGENWTNSGVFDGSYSHVEFLSNNDQTIDPGEDNTFSRVKFGGNATKTIVNHGLNIDNDLYIASGTTVDFGNLTHWLASNMIINNGTWHTEDAELIFDRNGTQYIPALTARRVIMRRYDSYNRYRYLSGDLNVGDLIIEKGISFRAVNDGDVYDMTIRGNLINNASMYLDTNKVYFEAENSDTVRIKSNGAWFYKVSFNKNVQNTRVYLLDDDMRVSEQLLIYDKAKLKLNGQKLYLGNNDPNTPDPPPNEEHYVYAGGSLEVDTGAALLFSTADAGDAQLTVYGSLFIVGSENANALVSRYEGSNRILITIESGGEVGAENYMFQYLSDSGFVVDAGAQIDPLHNFSNGTWSYLSTATTGKHYYWVCDADLTGIGTVDNVTFNFDGTPIQGVHFNVRRSASSNGTLEFGGILHGLLAVEDYEADPDGVNNPGLIVWPPVTQVQWTGAVSTDWFTAANWSPEQVPDQNTNAIIPKQANNPIITGANAVCRDLVIQDGIVQLNDGYDLSVHGDLYIGTGSEPGVLAVNAPNSTIYVYGNWQRGLNGLFIHGSGTVEFAAPTGIITIDPRNSHFYNVRFNGGAQFVISRLETFFDNDFVISNGQVYPSVNNYVIHIKGDYSRSTGAEFSSTVQGFVKIDGATAQSITNGQFYNLIIDGSGDKSTNGVCVVEGDLTVNAGTLVLGDTLKIFRNFYSKPGGILNDGGQQIKFYGYRWSGKGDYIGTGSVVFLRNGSQVIDSGKFHTLILQTNGSVNLLDSVFVTGDVLTVTPFNNLRLYDYALRNTLGTGTFRLGPGMRIYVSGYNNFPSGFDNYQIDPNSWTYYNSADTQIVAGFPVIYGNLMLYNGPKILGGDIDVNGSLYLADQHVSLDVTDNSYKITLQKDWYNYNGAKFYPHHGDVIFDGEGNSYIRLNEISQDSNYFYNLTVNKSSGTVYNSNANIKVLNNLRVLNGYFTSSRKVEVYGDMLAFSGQFGTAGTYVLKKNSGVANLQFNGSVLYNLIVDGQAHFIVQDGLTIYGNLKVKQGIFDGNGKEIQLGNGGEAHEIYGVYKVGPGGVLRLSGLATLRVMSGGQIWVVGQEDNIATVTNATGRYYFEIENGGKIFAKHYLFEYMSENGIYIKDGAIIDNNYNFSYGTFSNIAYGGIGLRIENNQNFTRDLGNQIRFISFPTNPGGGAHNIAKFVANSGVIEIEDYSGQFAGEDFDNDPKNLINWITPSYIVWTGNIDDDWYKPGNWQVNSGPERYPTKDDNVIIPPRVNQPIIRTDGAEAKTIEIQENAVLILNSSAATDTTLKVLGDIVINGTLQMTSGNDTLVVFGSWINNNNFVQGQGTVIFNNTEGLKTINNSNSPFYNLYINSGSTVQLNNSLRILNDFVIRKGEFDIGSSDNYLHIGGDLINYGDFNTRYSIITMEASSGTHYIYAGNSDLYSLNIEPDPSVVYLLSSDLNISHSLNVNSGRLDLNAKQLLLGDDEGIDVLSINGGELTVSANSQLLLADGVAVNVNSGGCLAIVGSDINNLAYLKSQSGYYNLRINSGGKLKAQFYDIENTDNEGVHLLPGALIDDTYNLADGLFKNGFNPGQYLWLENDFSDFTVTGVYFHPGASINVKRISGSGVITFEDAKGLLAGAEFEEDDGTADGGRVRWIYTHPKFIWTGAVNRDWNLADNWDGPEDRVPNSNDIVEIPDVSATTNNPPILGITASDDDGACYSLNIKQGGFLTIDNGKNLTVSDAVTVFSNGKIQVANGSVSTIQVGGIWAVDGQFIHGGSSTVEFNAPAGKIVTITGSSRFYNLVINSSSAEYLTGSSIYIDGDFRIQSGTFTITEPQDTIFLAGNWDNQGTFNNGNGVVLLNGSDQTIANSGSGAFYNLVLTGSGTKALLSDLTVEYDININSDVTFDLANYTLELKGDWINRGVVNGSNATLTLNGNKPQIVDNIAQDEFNTLVIDNSSFTFPQVMLYGKLRISEAGTLDLSDGVIETTDERKLILADDATVVNGGPDSYVCGPLFKEGDDDFTFHVGDGMFYAPLELTSLGGSATFKVQYFRQAYSDVASTASDVDHVSAYEYWTVDRLSGDATPYITLHWQDGEASEIDDLSSLIVAFYDSNTNQWENYGNNGTTGDLTTGSIISSEQFVRSGPFTFGSTNSNNPLHSFTQWTGSVSTDWHEPGNWTRGVPSATMDAVVPSEPNLQPVISSNAFTRKLHIEQGASVTVNPLNTLTVNGKLQIDGLITLKSDASGNAALLNNDQISYGENGLVIEQLYLKPKRYYYVSAPMSNVSSELFKGKPYEGTPFYNHNFYWYDETDESNDWMNGWHEYDGYLEIMRGYAVYLDREYTAEMKTSTDGPLNTGDKSISVTYTETAAVEDSKKGWNLIGNPFPAYLDWDLMVRNNVANSIYFWNGENYQYYVGSSDDDYHTDPAATNDATSIIPPMQGFFVKALDEGYVGAPMNARTTSAHAFYKMQRFKQEQKQSKTDYIRLLVYGNGKQDEALIRFIEPATEDFDPEYDAYKLISNYPGIPQVYTLTPSNERLAINSYRPLRAGDVIYLGFAANSSGIYTLRIPHFELSQQLPVWFIDIELGDTLEINGDFEYSFTSDADTFDRRFALKFGQFVLPDDPSQIDVQIYYYNGYIYLRSDVAVATVGELRLFDMQGRLIARMESVSEGLSAVKVPEIAQGFYLVEFENQFRKYHQKLAIIKR